MEFFTLIWDFILHMDKHLDLMLQNYGAWSYAILALVIFLETGLVVTPFLPGDSLLFAAGALSARGNIDPITLFVLLSAAAIVGDAVNYFIGRRFGEAALSHPRFGIKKKHIDRTEGFYAKYGGKTIVIARFVPIVRTFAPFLAGLGKMNYARFTMLNVTGGILWVALFIFGGFFFGDLPAVKRNFTLVIFGIIAVSLLPVVYEFMRARCCRAKT